MNEELMPLPYGKNFKECWESYVQFMLDNRRNASIKAQNCVLRNYLMRKYTEEEAIATVFSSKEYFLKHFLK